MRTYPKQPAQCLRVSKTKAEFSYNAGTPNWYVERKKNLSLNTLLL
jgi:hypothetical protein